MSSECFFSYGLVMVNSVLIYDIYLPIMIRRETLNKICVWLVFCINKEKIEIL